MMDVCEDIFSLPGGQYIAIRWPSEINAEEAQDLESWLNLVIRKIKRSVKRVPIQGREQGVQAVAPKDPPQP